MSDAVVEETVEELEDLDINADHPVDLTVEVGDLPDLEMISDEELPSEEDQNALPSYSSEEDDNNLRREVPDQEGAFDEHETNCVRYVPDGSADYLMEQ